MSQTETILLKRKLELEEELAALHKALEAIKSMSNTENVLPKFKSKYETFTRTGQYWLKNRFNPSMGYAVGNGYRILYQFYEGPNFVADYSSCGDNLDLEFTTFEAAKQYIEKYQNKGTIYTIISPDGEIVH